ncbi:MAG: hypothetical protein P0Y49_15355 [Candidatus Pedobacter colombiensis]|uniref:Uncharacterized protein n=1 Tax=Candidatus Pedobacter colombiensis TaxID=3121371 RepID=A0AAJ6B4Y2_9SPHI|nr:hypothetical protein [Pedobacter sp.]WEK18167.1 MAG: hypothetical protein P0Y49_15355 [Pedobacter sp.]
MARETDIIYNEALLVKQAQPELEQLNSPSSTAIWSNWLMVFARIIHLFEVKMDLFKAEVQEIIDNNQYGTLYWWALRTKEYQHGELLQFLNNHYVYPAIDVAKQIVGLVSITDERGIVKIKAAKIVANQPMELSAQEAQGLLSYCQQIRPAGTRIAVESLPADLMKVSLNIYYNAQIDLDNLIPNVEAAFVNYINTLEFDAVFYVNKMIDALQQVPGVTKEQVEVINIAAKQGTDPYTSFTSKYQASSGYFKIDPDFPLSATFNYIAG